MWSRSPRSIRDRSALLFQKAIPKHKFPGKRAGDHHPQADSLAATFQIPFGLSEKSTASEVELRGQLNTARRADHAIEDPAEGATGKSRRRVVECRMIESILHFSANLEI